MQNQFLSEFQDAALEILAYLKCICQKRFHGKNLLMTAIGEDVSYWLSSAMKGLLLADYSFDKTNFFLYNN